MDISSVRSPSSRASSLCVQRASRPGHGWPWHCWGGYSRWVQCSGTVIPSPIFGFHFGIYKSGSQPSAECGGRSASSCSPSLGGRWLPPSVSTTGSKDVDTGSDGQCSRYCCVLWTHPSEAAWDRLPLRRPHPAIQRCTTLWMGQSSRCRSCQKSPRPCGFSGTRRFMACRRRTAMVSTSPVIGRPGLPPSWSRTGSSEH